MAQPVTSFLQVTRKKFDPFLPPFPSQRTHKHYYNKTVQKAETSP